MEVRDPIWKSGDVDNDRICGLISIKCDLCDKEAVFDGLCEDHLIETLEQQKLEMIEKQRENEKY